MRLSEPDQEEYRVRVVYPHLSLYRYLAEDEHGWYTTGRQKAFIFASREGAEAVMEAMRPALKGFGTIDLEPRGSFDPDWTVPPGAHIEEELEYREILPDDFAKQVGLTGDQVRAILRGDLEITEEIADRLCQVLLRGKELLLNLERNYREDLRMGRTYVR